MSIDIFWGNIFKVKGKEETLHNFLKNNPLFQGFSSRDLKNIEKIIHLRKFKKDEIIFKEDEPGTGMYIIKSGGVRITKQKMKEGGISEEEIITTLKHNDFFGELTLIEKTRFPRNASAYAEEESELIGFFKPDLLEINERNPRLGIKIIIRIAEIIASRLRTTNSILADKNTELKKLQEQLPKKSKKITPF